MNRLRAVSNLAIRRNTRTRARENGLPREDAPRGEEGADFRARACISPESPKLETTHSLVYESLACVVFSAKVSN